MHFFYSFANSPAKRGVKNRTLTPDPRTSTKMSAILLQTPLVSCWHQRGAFGNPLSGRDFHPAHLGTSRHKLSMQGCSVRSSLRSCILRIGWELWGKNSHRNGSPDLESHLCTHAWVQGTTPFLAGKWRIEISRVCKLAEMPSRFIQLR